MSARYIAVFVPLLLVCTPSPTRGAVTAWTTVVVRVYDANGVIAGTNRQALDHARKALEAASIDVVWRMCPASPPCNRPLAPGELAIRIVRSPAPTVYTGTCRSAMRRWTHRAASACSRRSISIASSGSRTRPAPTAVLLGRAIAHELGHLLLATTTHGPVGLMRAHWSHEEVRRGQPRDWSFAPTELASMRRRAEARERDARLAWGTR